MHFWHDDHSTNINICKVGGWVGGRVGIQVLKRELHTHIHLDYTKMIFLSQIKINITQINYSK